MNTVGTPEEAVSVVRSGQRVFVHGAAMTPLPLVDALSSRAGELRDIEFLHIHTEGDAPYTRTEVHEYFSTRSLFIADNTREAVASGEADYVPMFLSDIPLAIRSGILPVDVALLQVSEPDRHGYCSLGASVDIALAAAQCAKVRIAIVNPQVPRTHGQGFLHEKTFDKAIVFSSPLISHEPTTPSERAQLIGRHIASLVEDGATLQLGIGEIPNAVVKELVGHKRLGLHTEMFSDGILELVESGALTGEEKRVMPGLLVTSFLLGSSALYRFVDDNPLVSMRECSFTNDPNLIRKNPKVTAINSALEVDLTGQVCADSIGYRQYSGVGGQLDFIRGAALSEGGKPIIALPSVTRDGSSRIVTTLKPGAAITTTRAHVRFVVTEWGIADLLGRTLRERAKLLIALAHPNHRESLEREAQKRGLFL